MNRRTALTSGGAAAWSAAVACQTGAADDRVAEIVRAGRIRFGLFPSFM